MDLLGMEYFVAVAKAGSLTAVAQHKFISEPAISRKLKAMEAELGVPLLKRTPKGMQTTFAGQVYLAHASQILDQCARLEKAMAPYRATEKGPFSISYTTLGEKQYADWFQTALAPAPRSMLLTPTKVEPEEAAEMLLTGEHSLAIMNLCNLPDRNAPFEWAVLRPSGVSAYVPAGHPLFTRSSISLCDLRDKKIVLFPQNKGRASYDKIMAAFLVAGFTPNVAAYITGTESFHMLIELEGYVGLMLSTSQVIASDTLHCIPIPELSTGFDLGLVWKKGTQERLKAHLPDLLSALPPPFCTPPLPV